MSNIAIETKNSLASALSKFSTYTVLVWPIRLLIIISAILIPVLFGLLIWFYLSHKSQIDTVIKKASDIEGMIESNYREGIDFIKNQVTLVNGMIKDGTIEDFVAKELTIPLRVIIVNFYNQANKSVQSIQLDTSDLEDITFSIGGKTSHIKNMETLIKTSISDIVNDVIPRIVDQVTDKILKQLTEGGNGDKVEDKKKELTKLLSDFANDKSHTLAYIMTQYKLFYEK